MENLPSLVAGLADHDAKRAFNCLQELASESARSNAAYHFMDEFIGMLADKNSYVRTRGLVLMAENARWDAKGKIDEHLADYLAHITDAKPITARQCIKMLPVLAQYKPALRQQILEALRLADASQYPDSMRPLVEKDIKACIQAIEKL